jgi:rhodanese-related sulfurtransferase
MRMVRASSWVAAVAVAACWLFPSSPFADELPPRQEGVRYTDVSTVKQWEAAGPVTFLDVRERDEFDAGHLPDAVNISYDQVHTIAGELPRETPIVLYCIHSAHRAPDAARRLQALGFANVHVLEGGIVAWDAGGQTIRAADLAATPTILPATERCAELGATTDRVAQ